MCIGTVNYALENMDVSDNFCQISFKFSVLSALHQEISFKIEKLSSSVPQFLYKTEKKYRHTKSALQTKNAVHIKSAIHTKSANTPRVLYTIHIKSALQTKRAWQTKIAWEPGSQGPPFVHAWWEQLIRYHFLVNGEFDQWTLILYLLYRYMYLAQSKPNARSLPAIGR